MAEVDCDKGEGVTVLRRLVVILERLERGLLGFYK